MMVLQRPLFIYRPESAVSESIVTVRLQHPCKICRIAVKRMTLIRHSSGSTRRLGLVCLGVEWGGGGAVTVVMSLSAFSAELKREA